MHNPTAIWFFIVPFALAAAVPGPAQGTLVSHVLSRGGRATIPFVAGMLVGNAIWLALAALGLTAIAEKFQSVFIVVKWLGVAYLMFVAWALWTKNTLQPQRDPGRSVGGGFAAGSLLTLSNPKAVIFFGAVLPHAFDMTSLKPVEITSIVGLGVAIDLTIQSIYLITASKVRSTLRSSRAMRRVNRTSAGLMAGCAGWLAFSR
ncbi:LysE family translocator [Rhizobium sp. 60-20]|uniref:LysE family translocator n=1 Tax=Rhizobium sp. 60-20 TaxID=1895819 RepID=UPI000926EBFB|nr:LysE family translocator [Rhizobium sp. 60-20]MBN8949843.1 LysE family translocator [Rhizobium tropici]OJY62773.1 MAG: amino acid transporter [Rhizobium sp. 60-20]